MNILIRCDAGGEYGLGHAVRMRALAMALAHRGATVHFITTTPVLEVFVAPFSCHYETRMPEPSGAILVIDTKAQDWANDNGVLWYAREKGDWIVRVDHPKADEDSCDLSITPCAHWSSETVSRLQQEFGNRFLYGWDYVMLPPEVTVQPPIPYSERKQGHIVFCAGGSDPTGALEKMFSWSQSLLPNVEKLFLMGQAYQGRLWNYYDNSSAVSLSLDNNCAILPFHHRYLREATLVVGMFGQTVYECLWYQTPMVIFAHTEENKQGARALQSVSEQQVCALGHLEDLDQAGFCDAIGLLYEATIRKVITGQRWIDGLGLQRVAEAILAL